MNDLAAETNLQILMSGKEKEQPQDEVAAVEEQISAASLGDECAEDSDSADNEAQAKMLSVFQQVRNQIRLEVGLKTPKGSMLELVQRLKDIQSEVTQENGEPEEKSQVGNQTEECKDEVHLKEEELCAIFEKKLKDSEEALRDEFKQQISQAHKDMQAYTDRGLKDLEFKMQSWHTQYLQRSHLKDQEGKGPDKKQKPSTATLSRNGRVLTRTMTTIIPKTCAPVIVGPRAKSETLSSRIVLRDPGLCFAGSRPYQNRKPLPPACPPLHQRKKPVRAKPKTGKLGEH